MLFGFNAFASSPFSGEVDTTKIAVTGQSVSSAVGTVTIQSIPAAIQVSGFGLSVTLGTFAVAAGGQIAVDASSEPAMDSALGSPTVSGTALVQPTGVSTSTALGTVLTRIGVPVNGVEVSSALGTVTAGAVQNQTISVSGLSTSVTLGGGYVVQANALKEVSGVVVSSAVGTPVILTEVVALPSGVSISSNLGTVRPVAWREVDDSATNTWTNVDDSATNNWLDAA